MTELSWEEVMTGPGMLGFDLETTGLDRTTARIVTASTIHVRPNHTPVAGDWLADPGIPIPSEATAVHGITTDHAQQHGRPHREVVEQVTGMLAWHAAAGTPLVVFNAPYDLTVLNHLCIVHQLPTLDDRLEELPYYVIDPLVLDRQMDPGRRVTGGRRLTYLCQQVYGVVLTDEEAHGSAADALAACRLAWKIARRYPHLARTPIDQLYDLQAEWYAEQQTELGAYLRSVGRGDDTDTAWPYAPAGGQPGLFDSPAPARDQGGLL